MEKLYTIVDKNTGQEFRAQFEGWNLAENEIQIDELRTEKMQNPYWDFDNKKFYDNYNNSKVDTEAELSTWEKQELNSQPISMDIENIHTDLQ